MHKSNNQYGKNNKMPTEKSLFYFLQQIKKYSPFQNHVFSMLKPTKMLALPSKNLHNN